MPRPLLVLLFLLSLARCEMDRISPKLQVNALCGRPGGKHNWYVNLRRADTQELFGGAIISDKHVITTKFAIMKKVQDTERMISVDELRVETILKDVWFDFFTFGVVTYGVKHIMVPLVKDKKNKDKLIPANLAIIQVDDLFDQRIIYICLQPKLDSPNSKFPVVSEGTILKADHYGLPTSVLTLWIELYWDFEENPIVCTYDFCDDISWSTEPSLSPNIGAVWYKQGNSYAFLCGVSIDRTSAVSTIYWSEFICKHTGVCPIRVPTGADSEYHYMQDGAIHYDMCSEDQRKEVAKFSTPFYRISRAELSMLRRNCGTRTGPSPELAYSFMVTLLADHCIYSTPCESDVKKCTGVLISQQHLITSTLCLQRIFVDRSNIIVIFTDHAPSDDEPFPFKKARKNKKLDLPIGGYDPTRVGRRWLRVDRITTPFTRIGEESYDFALLQLEQPIPMGSYIKPICLPSTSEFPKKKMNLARTRELPNAETKIIAREIEMEEKLAISRPDECRNLTSKNADNCLGFFITPGSPMNDISVGSPIFTTKEERAYLHGFLTTSSTNKTIGIRPAYFASFICIHTGVCEEGEVFETRLFLLYDWKDMSIPVDQIVQEMANWKNKPIDLKWDTVNKEMSQVVNAIIENNNNLRKLSKEEFAELQQECGKIPPTNRIVSGGTDFDIVQYPWLVAIAYREKIWFYEISPNPICGGAFISRRHVATARHCLVDTSPQDLVVLYGGSNAEKTDTFSKVHVRNVIYTDRHAGSAMYFDFGVLELEIDVQTSPKHQILCMSDLKTYEDELFDDFGWIFGAGQGIGKPMSQFQYAQFNFSDPLLTRQKDKPIRGKDWFIWSDDKLNPGIIGQGDSGSPIVRRRKGDGRFTLYGVVSHGVNQNLPRSLLTMMRAATADVCKMTGICHDNREDARLGHEIYVNGMRLC